MKKEAKIIDTTEQFESCFKHLGSVKLPDFTGIRIMMMPVTLGDNKSVPKFLKQYEDVFNQLCKMMDQKHNGETGYLTIDEKAVKSGETHRRAGLHVDGVYNGGIGGWGGGGGGWGSAGNGMITVSSLPGCKAYNQTFNGRSGKEGECDHMADQCEENKATIFQANQVYWVDGLCVHESMPMIKDCNRQFIRLSMPSKAPWFEGYTENPNGIKPTGEILPRRKFM